MLVGASISGICQDTSGKLLAFSLRQGGRGSLVAMRRSYYEADNRTDTLILIGAPSATGSIMVTPHPVGFGFYELP